MTRKRPEPEEVFLNSIKQMVRNLLINNPNYTNDEYFKNTGVLDTLKLIKDTKNRAEHILQKIDDWEHLVRPM